MRAWALALLLVVTTGLTGCGYNKVQSLDEQVKADWSEVVNQYQRRADLIPNLVATVKGFAIQEQQVLIGVTEARAKVGSIQATPELVNDPAAFEKFQQTQIEGTENRITVARNRYIDAVREYNTTIRQFPVNLTAKMFNFDVKPNFTVANEAEISTAPKVDFGNGVAPQASQGMKPAQPP